jgi:hypothetical protein
VLPPQWLADALLVVLRWLHTLAAVGLLGWMLVGVLQPALVQSGVADVGRRFKDVTGVTLVVFLATGAVLSFDRLSRGAGELYAATLAFKLLLAIATYRYATLWRHTGMRHDSRAVRWSLAAGTGAILLAALLKVLFERGVRSDF